MNLDFDISNVDLINSIPGAVGLKDINSTYIAGNTKLANYMGYKKPGDIVGLTDADVRCEMRELAHEFVAQDKQVIERGESCHLDIGRYPNGDLKLHFSTKKPLLSNGDIKGTVFTCVELKSKLFSCLYNEYLSINGPGFYAIGGQYHSYNLTRRESECLFYLIRGFTVSQIADRLHRSIRTIEKHVCHLKDKLSCQSRAELTEKSIHLGFVFNIPLSFLDGVKSGQ